MKSLSESLFDTDLVGKNLTLDRFFDISVNRYNDIALRGDKRAEKEIKKQISSINLKSLDCKELMKNLYDISKKHIKNWQGGGCSYSFYDKSGQKINYLNNLQSFDLLDMSKILVYCEDWNKDHIIFRTHYTLIRK